MGDVHITTRVAAIIYWELLAVVALKASRRTLIYARGELCQFNVKCTVCCEIWGRVYIVVSSCVAVFELSRDVLAISK